MENINLTELLGSPEIEALEKFAQVIPADLMQEIAVAAKVKNISIELETLSRFLATFIAPQEFGLQSHADKILKQDFSADEAVAECQRKRNAWLYLYEIEKLKMYLKLKDTLPRDFKEKFLLIDVKAETQRILDELAVDGAGKKNST